MNDSDLTLTSPLSATAAAERPLLAVTIAWHPDSKRIGEQFICSHSAFALSRFLPLFQKPGSDGLGLGYRGISREPISIRRDEADGIHVLPPQNRMVVEINGVEMTDAAYLSSAQIDAGVVVGLGRAVLLCIHFMRCLPKHNPINGFFGVGEAAIKTRDLIRQAARTAGTVLLLGETGTGKEVAARGIHALSQRANAPLVSVNMAALNESLAAADLFGAVKGAYTGAQNSRNGLFAQAQDATLFLDEVGNTPAIIQPMLLRVLETGDYRPLGAQHDIRSNARLIAATDQDLYGGGFNQALLRRLESFIIQIPPLRARREDIGLLLIHLQQSSKQEEVANINVPVDLISRFLNYDWPGNIRQLTHVFKRTLLALQNGDMPAFDSLVDLAPQRGTTRADAKAAATAMPNGTEVTAGRKRLTDFGEPEVLAAMVANDWYIQGAAQTLGVSRPSMYKLLESHSQIRRAEQIGKEELITALEQCGGDLEDCAAHLKTPTEALRRYLNLAGLVG